MVGILAWGVLTAACAGVAGGNEYPFVVRLSKDTNGGGKILDPLSFPPILAGGPGIDLVLTWLPGASVASMGFGGGGWAAVACCYGRAAGGGLGRGKVSVAGGICPCILNMDVTDRFVLGLEDRSSAGSSRPAPSEPEQLTGQLSPN